MGWLVYDTPPWDIPAEIDRICTWESDGQTGRPLRKCRIGSTWYVAVDVQLKDPAADTCGYEADALGLQGARGILGANADAGPEDADRDTESDGSRVCQSLATGLPGHCVPPKAERWRCD